MCVIILEGLKNIDEMFENLENFEVLPFHTSSLDNETLSDIREKEQAAHINARTENLRSIISITNSKTSGEILRRTGNMILPWLNGAKTELTKDESSLLYALIMKSKGEEGWYDPNNKGL